MATTKYLHVGIDGSSAVAGERVVVRSLSNIGQAATDTANTMQRSANRMKGDLEGTGNASERSGRVVVRNLQTIKKEAELAGVSVKDLEHMFVRLAARTAQIALIYGSLSTVKNVIGETLKYLGQLETSTLGIATSFLAGGKYIDQITGKALQGSQALKAAQQNSLQVINELKAANFETIATLDQLIYAYQVTLPVALAKGFDQKQVLDFTKAMVQAAGAIGLPLDQMAEETRAMLTGQISRHSRIAQVLGLRPEDIKQFKGDASGLFDFLMGRLEAYGEAGKESMKTWAGLWSNLTDMMKQLGGVGGQPLFEGVKATLQEIMDAIGKINPKTKEMEFDPAFVSAVKEIGEGFKTLFDIIVSGGRFIAEHREAIFNLASLYGTYRASMMATAIIKKLLYVDTQQEIVVEQARTQTIFQANLAEKARIASINEQLAANVRLAISEAEKSAAKVRSTTAEAANTAARVAALQVMRDSISVDIAAQKVKVAELGLNTELAASESMLAAKLTESLIVQKEQQMVRLVALRNEYDALLKLNGSSSAKILLDQQQAGVSRQIATLEKEITASKVAHKAAQDGATKAELAYNAAKTQQISLEQQLQTVLGANVNATIAKNKAQEAATIASNAHIATQEAATIAANKHASALAAQTTMARTTTAAMNGLRSVMTALGGPIGVITTLLGLGATAWLIWGDNARKATEEDLENSLFGITDAIKKQNQALEEQKRIREGSSKTDGLMSTHGVAGASDKELQAIRGAQHQLMLYEAQVKKLVSENPELRNQLNSSSGSMSTLGNEGETARGKLFALQNQIKNLRSEIGTAQNEIAKRGELQAGTTYSPTPPRDDVDGELNKELDKIAQYNAAVRKYNEDVEKRNTEARLKFKEEGYNRELELFKNANQEKLAALESAHAQELINDRNFATQKLELTISGAQKELDTIKKQRSDVVNELANYKREVDEINRTSVVGRNEEARNGEVERRNTIIKEYNRLLLENQKLETDEATASSKLRVLQQELSDLPRINAYLDSKLLKELEIKRLESERLPLLAQMKENELTYQEMSQKNIDITIINLQKEIDLIKQRKELEDNTTSQKDKVSNLRIGNIRDPYSREIAQIKNRYEVEIREINKRDMILRKSYESMPKVSLAAAEVQKQIDLNQKERDELTIERNNLMADLRMKTTADYIGYAGQGFQLLADIQDQSSRSGFESAKNYNAAAVIMNTASAVMQQLASNPGPQGWVLAALAAATGAVQYSKIMSTSYGGGGSISASIGGSASFSGGSAGTKVGAPDRAIRDSVGEESLRSAAVSMENASLAITKVADGLTKISDAFVEGGMLSMAVGASPNIGLNLEYQKNELGNLMQAGKDWVKYGLKLDPITGLSKIFKSLGKAIFGGSWYTTGGGVELGLSDGELIGRSYTTQKKEGGLFGSDKKRTRYGVLDEGFATTLDVVIDQIKSSLVRASVAMGTTVNFGSVDSSYSRISTAGKKAEDIEKEVEKWLTDMSGILAKTMQGLEAFSYYGENAFDAAMRLVTALQSMNEGMELIGRTQFDATLEAANMAYKLQDLMGGADKASDKIANYFEEMFTEQEQDALKQAQLARQMSVAFREMGVTLPETRSEFISLVNSLDLTTERGRALFASLMEVSGGFAELQELEEKRLEAVKEATEDLLVRYLRALNQNGIADLTETFIAQQKELKEWADQGFDTTKLIKLQALEWTAALNQVKSGITDTIAEIKGGDLSTMSPEAKYRSLGVRFASEMDPEKLQSLATEFLESSRQYNASSEAYVSDYNEVLRKLEASTIVYDNVKEQLTVMKDLLGVNENVELILKALLKGLVPDNMLGFAVGSANIPFDMTARVHQGEMIIDPVSSRILRTYGIPVYGSADGGSEELQKMNEELREQNEHLAATVRVLQNGFTRLIQSQEEMSKDISEIKTKARLEAAA